MNHLLPNFSVQRIAAGDALCRFRSLGRRRPHRLGVRPLAMADSFTDIFVALRAILQRHAGSLAVSADSPARFCLEGGLHPKHRKPMPIAWVEIGNYVSFHHMGVYARPDLLQGLSKRLRARMQGKSCFDFTSVDGPLFDELEERRPCIQTFQKLPYLR